MAGSTGTKCPVCGKSIGVGLVSGTLIQHENKHGERCEGTGMAPVVAAPRASASGPKAPARPRASAASTGSSSAGAAYKPSTGTSVTGASPAAAGSASRTTPATRRGVTVRKVEVDPEWLAAREAKQARLRDERDARARARNEIYSTGIDEEPAQVADPGDAADARDADDAEDAGVTPDVAKK